MIIHVVVCVSYITLCFVLWLLPILYISRCMQLSWSALYCRVSCTVVLPSVCGAGKAARYGRDTCLVQYDNK